MCLYPYAPKSPRTIFPGAVSLAFCEQHDGWQDHLLDSFVSDGYALPGPALKAHGVPALGCSGQVIGIKPTLNYNFMGHHPFDAGTSNTLDCVD